MGGFLAPLLKMHLAEVLRQTSQGLPFIAHFIFENLCSGDDSILKEKRKIAFSLNYFFPLILPVGFGVAKCIPGICK